MKKTKENLMSMKPKITKTGQLQLFNLCKSEIFAQFKRVFNDNDESQIHNCYSCTEINCNEICSDYLKTAKKER